MTNDPEEQQLSTVNAWKYVLLTYSSRLQVGMESSRSVLKVRCVLATFEHLTGTTNCLHCSWACYTQLVL